MELALGMRRTLEVSAVWNLAGTVVQPRSKVELREQGWSATAVTWYCDERHTFFTGRDTAGTRLTNRYITHHETEVVAETAALSFHAVSLAEEIRLIALSARAVMVRLGFTPRFVDTTDPSQMYMLR